MRALCYVISGQDQHKEEGMRAVLDALLAGKQQWDRDLQVSDHPAALGSLDVGGEGPSMAPSSLLLNPHRGGTASPRSRGEEGGALPPLQLRFLSPIFSFFCCH